LKFAKPPLSYTDQATLLLSRGMVADADFLVRQLQAVGYYRLCAYWYPFKQPDNTFLPGTNFDTVWRRYRFDRRLRLSVIDAIERVEVGVRSALMTELAMRFGAFAHLDHVNFPGVKPQRHAQFIDDLREEASRSREAFVEHFRATYDEFPDLPIWAAAETMTFGAMFTLFKMSDRRIQKDVARRYRIAAPVLLSWLQTLNYVRNICAHHARLWNRELAIKPTVPYVKNRPEWHNPLIPNNRVFAVLTLLQDMLRTIAPQSQWRERWFELLNTFPDVPIASMGMEPAWRQHPIWL
jgi:abortive infection bacteriophage resistance protein